MTGEMCTRLFWKKLHDAIADVLDSTTWPTSLSGLSARDEVSSAYMLYLAGRVWRAAVLLVGRGDAGSPLLSHPVYTSSASASS